MNPSDSSTVAQPMRCMEIWGGNRAVREAIGTPGLDIWVYSEPFHAEARGGDVHYVSLCGGGIITRLIVADVSGHGAEVSGFSHALRNLMRRNINSKSQKRLVKALNRQFAELAQLQRFATAVVATYLATDRSLTVCNAAHPRPLRYHSASGTWSFLSHETVNSVESAMNLPLGIDEEATYDQFSFILDHGDLVIFYTDALTEAMDSAGTLLGESGLLEIARGLDLDHPDQIVSSLLRAVQLYRTGNKAEDDVTLLVLRHNGGGARKASVLEKLDVYAKVFGLKPV